MADFDIEDDDDNYDFSPSYGRGTAGIPKSKGGLFGGVEDEAGDYDYEFDDRGKQKGGGYKSKQRSSASTSSSWAKPPVSPSDIFSLQNASLSESFSSDVFKGSMDAEDQYTSYVKSQTTPPRGSTKPAKSTASDKSPAGSALANADALLAKYTNAGTKKKAELSRARTIDFNEDVISLSEEGSDEFEFSASPSERSEDLSTSLGKRNSSRNEPLSHFAMSSSSNHFRDDDDDEADEEEEYYSNISSKGNVHGKSANESSRVLQTSKASRGKSQRQNASPQATSKAMREREQSTDSIEYKDIAAKSNDSNDIYEEDEAIGEESIDGSDDYVQEEEETIEDRSKRKPRSGTIDSSYDEVFEDDIDDDGDMSRSRSRTNESRTYDDAFEEDDEEDLMDRYGISRSEENFEDDFENEPVPTSAKHDDDGPKIMSFADLGAVSGWHAADDEEPDNTFSIARSPPLSVRIRSPSPEHSKPSLPTEKITDKSSVKIIKAANVPQQPLGKDISNVVPRNETSSVTSTEHKPQGAFKQVLPSSALTPALPKPAALTTTTIASAVVAQGNQSNVATLGTKALKGAEASPHQHLSPMAQNILSSYKSDAGGYTPEYKANTYHNSVTGAAQVSKQSVETESSTVEVPNTSGAPTSAPTSQQPVDFSVPYQHLGTSTSGNATQGSGEHPRPAPPHAPGPVPPSPWQVPPSPWQVPPYPWQVPPPHGYHTDAAGEQLGAQSQPHPHAQPQTHTHTQPQTQSHPHPHAQTQTHTHTHPHTQPQTQPQHGYPPHHPYPPPPPMYGPSYPYAYPHPYMYPPPYAPYVAPYPYPEPLMNPYARLLSSPFSRVYGGIGFGSMGSMGSMGSVGTEGFRVDLSPHIGPYGPPLSPEQRLHSSFTSSLLGSEANSGLESTIADLIKELRDAKQDASWAKEKLAEIIMMVSKNERLRENLDAMMKGSKQKSDEMADAASEARATARDAFMSGSGQSDGYYEEDRHSSKPAYTGKGPSSVSETSKAAPQVEVSNGRRSHLKSKESTRSNQVGESFDVDEAKDKFDVDSLDNVRDVLRRRSTVTDRYDANQGDNGRNSPPTSSGRISPPTPNAGRNYPLGPSHAVGKGPDQGYRLPKCDSYLSMDEEEGESKSRNRHRTETSVGTVRFDSSVSQSSRMYSYHDAPQDGADRLDSYAFSDIGDEVHPPKRISPSGTISGKLPSFTNYSKFDSFAFSEAGDESPTSQRSNMSKLRNQTSSIDPHRVSAAITQVPSFTSYSKFDSYAFSDYGDEGPPDFNPSAFVNKAPIQNAVREARTEPVSDFRRSSAKFNKDEAYELDHLDPKNLTQGPKVIEAIPRAAVRKSITSAGSRRSADFPEQVSARDVLSMDSSRFREIYLDSGNDFSDTCTSTNTRKDHAIDEAAVLQGLKSVSFDSSIHSYEEDFDEEDDAEAVGRPKTSGPNSSLHHLFRAAPSAGSSGPASLGGGTHSTHSTHSTHASTPPNSPLPANEVYQTAASSRSRTQSVSTIGGMSVWDDDGSDGGRRMQHEKSSDSLGGFTYSSIEDPQSFSTQAPESGHTLRNPYANMAGKSNKSAARVDITDFHKVSQSVFRRQLQSLRDRLSLTNSTSLGPAGPTGSSDPMRRTDNPSGWGHPPSSLGNPYPYPTHTYGPSAYQTLIGHGGVRPAMSK